MPVRIQRRRIKGFKAPPGTVYVGRPTKWGNPYAVGIAFPTAEEAVGAYCTWLASCISHDDIRAELRGKNLSCWCRVGTPCHADRLLEIANS